jgi:hypothetical protein
MRQRVEGWPVTMRTQQIVLCCRSHHRMMRRMMMGRVREMETKMPKR